MCLISFQCFLVGSELNRANKFTAKTISDLVHCAKYIKAPIALKYGTSGSSISSSGSLGQNESLWGLSDRTTIFWRSTKQTLVAISINHSEIISLYEDGKECVWLKSVISHIQSICQMTPVNSSPTIIYEDNVACVAHIIKGDKTKHILPKHFYL